MKTAVEQLIEEMKSYSYKVSKEGNLDMVAAFDYAIGIAKKYKEKEKSRLQKHLVSAGIGIMMQINILKKPIIKTKANERVATI